ncbi:MAG: phosphopentomutase [Acidobacteria bacterium]|nr:phosphopentomutase [Acidobacteriota bacterium]
MPHASPFTRAIVIVLDSVGVGELPDAARYGDEGSNTLHNISRLVRLQIPALRSLGLGNLVALQGVDPVDQPGAAYGRMAEASAGKDSVTGHWEMTGIVLDRAFPVFPEGFPPEVIASFEREIGRPTLANRAASGTQIIQDLGAEHMRTGAPIVYTSADSVFQIAAHESVVSLEELYRICDVAYRIAVEGLGMGRVIARPFVGEPGHFMRTANRRDFAVAPPGATLLDRLKDAGHDVIAIGKIEDLFAGRGITHAYHASSDDEVMDQVERSLDWMPDGLLFANLVDFDTVYGHRNDAAGYAGNLERFDARLSELLARLRPDDLVVVTADHGNDPTTPSTDHSREYVPLLVTGGNVRAGVDLGTRETFADLGQTLAGVFLVPPLAHGTSFLAEIA